MKYDAVIFDLFGTIIDFLPKEDYDTALKNMAEAISAPPDDFIQMWKNTRETRDIGMVKTVAEDVTRVATLLGLKPTPSQVASAKDIRLEIYRRNLEPRDGAIELLETLREKGLKTALISVACPAIPAVWDRSRFAGLFDACVFSCHIGLYKPDPAIYLAACEKIDVSPEKCLYVGDGWYRELTGARNLGMHSVLIQPEYDSRVGLDREDSSVWDGPMVRHLAELLEFVK